MYLEAKFEDGAVGFYPVTPSSTITITEPAPNDSTAAPSTTFSAQGIQSVELVDGEIPTLPEHDDVSLGSAGTVTYSGDVSITSTTTGSETVTSGASDAADGTSALTTEPDAPGDAADAPATA